MCTVATVRRLCIYGEEEGKAETGNVNVDKMYNRDQSPLSRISLSWLCAHHLLPPPLARPLSSISSTPRDSQDTTAQRICNSIAQTRAECTAPAPRLTRC